MGPDRERASYRDRRGTHSSRTGSGYASGPAPRPAPLTEPAAELPAGTRLAHYEVREVLGTGGMGTVYLAHDTALDRPVALKVLRPEVGDDPALADRFVREARAAARVSHPNLTHVYFVGTEGGRPFFAMEYCPGATLEATVKEKGPFPLQRGLDVLAQAARGLAAAHGAGVVHRDVKPSNLMLLPDGTVKVADFGLAKSLQGDVQATAGRLMGTPSYMSPEQVRGKPVDGRTDVYLLGLTAFFVFTGKPAYGSDQLGEVINDQMNSPMPPLSSFRPDLPPALDEALARMCAKDPAKRPATMGEVAAMLEELRPRPLIAAPLLARGTATLLDGLLTLAGWGGVAFAITFALHEVGWDILETTEGERGKYTLAPPQLFNRAVLLGVLLVLTLWLERKHGATLGKIAFHLQVVRKDGARPGLRVLFYRFLVKYPGVAALFVPSGMSIVVLSLLGLQGVVWGACGVAYFFAEGRTLTDILTGTRVVNRATWGGSRVP